MKKMAWVLGILLLVAAVAVPLYSQRSAGGQTHMQSALEHLRAAKAELQAAEADKGGHRAQAIEFTNRAIQQAEAGIEFARTH